LDRKHNFKISPYTRLYNNQNNPKQYQKQSKNHPLPMGGKGHEEPFEVEKIGVFAAKMNRLTPNPMDFQDK